MNEALVKALSELTNPHKDSKADTGKFVYGYASLASILDHVRPVLKKHGLAVTQSVQSENGAIGVETVFIHKDGIPWRSGVLWLGAQGTPQQVGSSISYARRYSLMTALGIAADEDDDGASASQVQVQKPAPKKEAKKRPQYLESVQLEVLQLADMDKDTARGLWNLAMEALNIPDGKDPSPIQANQALEYIKENLQDG